MISCIALYITLRDRRPRLTLRGRKGDWYTLTKAVSKSNELLFKGVVEVYNLSARANAIRGYGFWNLNTEGKWVPMESEIYHEWLQNESVGDRNVTPLPLAPYSGAEVHVLAIMKMPQPYEIQVRIEVEDLFGKRHQVEVKAVS